MTLRWKPPAGRVHRLLVRVTLVTIALSAARLGATAQSAADSLAQALGSSSVTARAGSVARLGALPLADIPPAVRTRLVALLESEGIAIQVGTPLPTVSDTGDVGEEYASYVTDLASLVLSFQDTRALRGLCLAGLDASRDVQLFVTTNAGASYAFLEEVWTRPARRQALLETWGRMLRIPAPSLSASQLTTIRRHVSDAASSDPVGFLWAASLGHLADLEPVVRQVGAAATDEVITARAASVGTTLTPLRTAMSSYALLTSTQVWLNAACAGASGSRHGACQSLDNHFDNALKHLGGNGNAAVNELNSLIGRATTARDHGDFTAYEAALIIENATLVRSRL